MRPHIEPSELFRQQWAAIANKSCKLEKFNTLAALMESLRNYIVISSFSETLGVLIENAPYKMSLDGSQNPNGQWRIILKDITPCSTESNLSYPIQLL